MQATHAIEGLLVFAQAKGLLSKEDIWYARNMLLFAMRLDAPAQEVTRWGDAIPDTATALLAPLLDDATRRGIIQNLPFYREQFSAHLMNLLTPLPSSIQQTFRSIQARDGIEAATDWFYALCRANDYIRVDEIAKNVAFEAESPYGTLEITINLSKPEKDPREIALLKSMPSVGYPKCMLCVENEGFAGRPGYPSHENLRMIPIKLRGESWHLQYSPYAYYEEHCIALNDRHLPMSISRRTFDLLLDFADQAPHYFIGSNADLPIVGGSILSHDHFQGGRHVFPMDKARPYADFFHKDFPQIRVQAVRWPMTCLRLTGTDKPQLIALATHMHAAWTAYDDEALDILHETGGEPHNTVTPIARRMADGQYQLQIVLRNNRTSPEHPLGIFHPHAECHHIKRENIGLIEVMGLFILPGRLCDELDDLKEFLTGKRAMETPAEDDRVAQHYPWLEELVKIHGNELDGEAATRVLREAVGITCTHVLEDSGVFKASPDGDAGLARFLASAGIVPQK